MRSLTALFLLLATTYPGLAHAQEPLDGAALYLEHNCHICHGEGGAGGVRSGYPAISPQDKSYLIRQIADIRDGVRENGQAKLMRPLVKGLSDREIEAIATYLSTGL